MPQRISSAESKGSAKSNKDLVEQRHGFTYRHGSAARLAGRGGNRDALRSAQIAMTQVYFEVNSGADPQDIIQVHRIIAESRRNEESGEAQKQVRAEQKDREQQRSIVVSIDIDEDCGADGGGSGISISKPTRIMCRCHVKNLIAVSAQEVQDQLARKFKDFTYHPSRKGSDSAPALSKDFGKTVPVVCVCVQGGAGTVDTVLQV